jgi:hypothetical protein
MYGLATVATAMIGALVFIPALRASFWTIIAWAIFLIASAIVLVVIGNIVNVLYQMYVGYDSETDRPDKAWEDVQKQIPRAGSESQEIARKRVA